MLGEERKYRQSHLILFVVSHLSFFLGLYLFPLSRYLLFFFSIVNSVLWGCGFCLILQVLLCPRVCVLVTQSCPTLCGPTDCRLPGFSVRGIFQARILEWVAISFSRASHEACLIHSTAKLFRLSPFRLKFGCIGWFICHIQSLECGHRVHVRLIAEPVGKHSQ